MAKSQIEGTVDQLPEGVADAVRRYAAEQRWKLDNETTNSGVLKFKTGRNLSSYAQTVTVTMTPAEGQATSVLVQTAVFQLYDWGRGKKLGQALLASLNARPLGASG